MNYPDGSKRDYDPSDEELPLTPRAARLQWLEDHADEINEDRRERRLDRHENPPLHTSFDLY
jgi:hypothetical protein